VSSNGETQPAVLVEKVSRHFRTSRGGVIHAACSVSFEAPQNAVTAIVGESGSGKTTLLRIIAGLERSESGSVELQDGLDLVPLRGAARRRARRKLAMVFQHPYQSLDPRLTVGDTLREPARVAKIRPPLSVEELLDLVHLPRDSAARLPYEFSGGQQQRIAIARALALEPQIILLDEALSALDATVKAQLIGLLSEIQKRQGCTYIMVSHDLNDVAALAHRIYVMYQGQFLESGSGKGILTAPTHPYTQMLVSAVLPHDVSAARSRLALFERTWDPSAERPTSCPAGASY
jgi:ABC-type glutathione transport system ATPase component